MTTSLHFCHLQFPLTHGRNDISCLQGFAGTMIRDQPIFIKGVNETNQELMKESAFGAMGMFIFLFSSSVIYLFLHRKHQSEDDIMARGYMRPPMQSSGAMRMSDYQVELPRSEHGSPYNSDEGEEEEEEEDQDMSPVDLLS